MKKRIPFVPLSFERAKIVAGHLQGWGEMFTKAFPSLHWELEQSELDMEPREWGGIAVWAGLLFFTVITLLLMGLFIIAGMLTLRMLAISFLAGLGIGFGTLFYMLFYPRLLSSRKVKELERNLPQALHHLLVHVRSGVPLFNSFVSIARAGYGTLSKEFGKAVNEITTGVSEIHALEELARNNPSQYFRRVLWQIVNAMKSGADIGVTIKEIVEDLAIDQRVAIKKYGSELNPLALFYMVLVVIFPTLGIVFLLIISSFVGAVFMDIHLMLMAILAFLFVVQIMFIGMIKSKRPAGVD